MLTCPFFWDMVSSIREEIMKRILLVTFASLALVGCGTKTIVVQEPAPTTKAPTITQAPEVLNPEQKFLEGVTADYPREVSILGKTKTIEFGKLMCQAIDEGTTLNDLVRMSTAYDVDAGFIGSVIREAVHNFCPENQWFIDSALNA